MVDQGQLVNHLVTLACVIGGEDCPFGQLIGAAVAPHQQAADIPAHGQLGGPEVVALVPRSPASQPRCPSRAAHARAARRVFPFFCLQQSALRRSV